ncbi:MAG: pyrroloquinoline quinone biosynthesis protein [Acetobacteraceae bacterium]|nr:pyrroloquinoline quinone biosynthesis protein [Acetobacteraceae bacterium]
MTDRQPKPIAVVLGSAAGGGFPQWNCGCRLCSLVRAGDPRVRAATQASVAVSGDGESWLLVGASPDLRQQLSQTPRLWPRTPGRDSPITGVLLTGGDVDAIAGLLVLRERQPFTIYAPAALLDVLADNHVFDVLDPALVRRVEVTPMQPMTCAGNLTLTLLPMPGKVPLYQEVRGATEPEAAPAYAALLHAGGRSVIVAPGCAEITDAVHTQLMQADVLFFDGTLFTDDEMIAAGLGAKTGRRMGHTPISGPNGTLTKLSDLPGRRIFLHINNTNPILLSDSPERRAVEAAGFEVAYDGMEIDL